MFPTTTTTTTTTKKNPTTSSSPRGYYVSSFASSKHRSFFAFREGARVLRVSIFRAPQLPRGRIGRKKRACVFLYIFSPFSNGKEKEEKTQNSGTTKRSRASLSPFLSLAESANAAKEEHGKCFLSLKRFSLSRGVCRFPKMCFRRIRSRERY